MGHFLTHRVKRVWVRSHVPHTRYPVGPTFIVDKDIKTLIPNSHPSTPQPVLLPPPRPLISHSLGQSFTATLDPIAQPRPSRPAPARDPDLPLRHYARETPTKPPPLPAPHPAHVAAPPYVRPRPCRSRSLCLTSVKSSSPPCMCLRQGHRPSLGGPRPGHRHSLWCPVIRRRR
jgi:hypothetical protein